MIEQERQVFIMDRLRERGFVSVKDLMKDLETSRSSVMRDLSSLEGRGLLVRTHGGASLPGVNETLSRMSEPDVREKGNVNAGKKRAVSEAAAKTVQAGMCLYLDSGTTPVYLLPYISHLEVRIVTPSVYLLKHLPEHAKAEVVLLGGVYDEKYDMNTGAYCLSMLDQFRFDAGFFSANAIDLKTGHVMVADFGLSAMKQRAMERSIRKYLLADETKTGRIASCTYAALNEFDAVFTNRCKGVNVPDNVIRVKEKET
ncbi:MAG: DeoR/GlpR transcriptional regulator [Solobacterium sp.]|nr:DeoR/GlpR transcriptional regulator [Solobacterium sp.]